MIDSGGADVFTYGSLMFAEVWSRVVAGDYRHVDATLHDHARFAIVGETYPGMVPALGQRVAGVLHRAVDAADLARLDAFEGPDYRRAVVPVVLADGTTVRAETYVYRLVERLLATPWAPDAFEMRRFLETYCRIPPVERPAEPPI